jgi:branched-chain amino acid aminotransferase
MKPTRFIWHGGKLVPWDQATVHVLTHGLHYGSSVFEGIRSYPTNRGPAFFRLDAHLRRFFESARIYRMSIPYSPDHIAQACHEVVRENRLPSAYVRPIAYRGYGSLTVAPGGACPIEVSIAAIEWGAYLGEEAVDVGVSSWSRLAPNTMPTMAKAGGNYLSSQLITMEAQRHGYAEGIGLDQNGYVSEGAGENLFLVRDGAIFTPPVSASILPGITRDSVIALARRAGFQVREEPIPREALYLADELFMTGTATEIAAIRSVDGLAVKGGPVTEELRRSFFGLFTGETEDRWGWLQPIQSEQACLR